MPSPDTGDKKPEEGIGLPGFQSWRAVYVAVLLVFVIWVGLLSWLTRYYSS